MSKSGVMAVLEKAVTDAQFRETWRANPDKAFAAFDLTAEEAAALKAQDPTAVRKLGIELDERLSKRLAGN